MILFHINIYRQLSINEVKMKVLFQARPALFSASGGDTTQIIKTKEILQKLGLKVDLSLEWEPSVAGYDLVHVFNLTKPDDPYLQAVNAKKYGTPVVLSTIYWDLRQVNKFAAQFHILKQLLGPIALNDNIKTRLLGIRDYVLGKDPGLALRTQRKIGLRKQQELLLSLCDLLLPNSVSEAELIRKNFRCASQHHVVPNGVEVEFLNSKSECESIIDKDDYILSVAHLSARKNQFALIEAAAELKLPLIIVGRYNDLEQRYSNKCIELCRRYNVTYINFLPREKLVALYRRAKVHALVSWVETPGLASLEAALCGCNIVTTEIGGTREYFKDMAWYCNPIDPDSISKALLSAYNAPKSDRLAQHIMNNFTWQRAGEETYNAYVNELNAV